MNDLRQFIENNFSLTLNDSNLDSESAYLKYLHEKLTDRIVHFLRVDIDKLTQALYRIDVDDQLVDNAFNLGEIHLIAAELSELIIQRQLKKLHYSTQFKKESS